MDGPELLLDRSGITCRARERGCSTVCHKQDSVDKAQKLTNGEHCLQFEEEVWQMQVAGSNKER